MTKLKTSDFDYHLPEELIAKYPLVERSASRLLCMDRESKTLKHMLFKGIVDLVNPNDLLVFNNTRVIPARLFGQKQTGGKIECLVERVIDAHRVLAHLKASKSPKPGAQLVFADTLEAEVLSRQGDLFELTFLGADPVFDVLEQYGHMPLPPYIDREDGSEDVERYQTVYSEHKGAVAAPTAGLHFDEAILKQLTEKGVDMAYVTLHVGAGTFQPVRVESIKDHHMHSEYMILGEDVCEAVNACKKRGGRVIAVGTTSVRCLEAAAQTGELKPYQGDTDIFIYPGYQFKCVDSIITNFHLPQSTLLMLISAFADKELVMQAYEEAIKEKYRFYSYGDAMILL